MIYCELCHREPATDEHHLINGYGLRKIADADDNLINICRGCHTIIHSTAQSEKLCKMLGQALWEQKAILMCINEDMREECATEARKAFRERYGRSYL